MTKNVMAVTTIASETWDDESSLAIEVNRALFVPRSRDPDEPEFSFLLDYLSPEFYY